MINVEFKFKGIEEVKALLSPKKFGYALRNALNNTARLDIKPALEKEVEDVFDRPTKIIKKGFYTKLLPSIPAVIIGIKDKIATGISISEILKPHIEGGTREMKRSEKYLGYYYIPGAGAKLDVHGNIPGSEVTRILSQTKSLWEVGYLANITPRSRAIKNKRKNFEPYFNLKHQQGKLKPGVYQKTKTGIRPILVKLRNTPYYKIRFRFFEIVKREFFNNIRRRFNEAVMQEMMMRK